MMFMKYEDNCLSGRHAVILLVKEWVPVIPSPVHVLFVYCNLSSSHVYQSTFNLMPTGPKQMPTPFLILKLTWNNSNKMKHTKPTF